MDERINQQVMEHSTFPNENLRPYTTLYKNLYHDNLEGKKSRAHKNSNSKPRKVASMIDIQNTAGLRRNNKTVKIVDPPHHNKSGGIVGMASKLS